MVEITLFFCPFSAHFPPFLPVFCPFFPFFWCRKRLAKHEFHEFYRGAAQTERHVGLQRLSVAFSQHAVQKVNACCLIAC